MTLVTGVDIDAVDADGFNDFTVADVYFDHRPGRAGGDQEAFYKVWWPGHAGAGRMILYRGRGWYGCAGETSCAFHGVGSKTEAVRRLVAREWDLAEER